MSRSTNSRSTSPNLSANENESDSASDSGPEIELLVTGRERRSTAGNRLRNLLDIEETLADDDDENGIFAESENDEDFVSSDEENEDEDEDEVDDGDDIVGLEGESIETEKVSKPDDDVNSGYTEASIKSIGRSVDGVKLSSRKTKAVSSEADDELMSSSDDSDVERQDVDSDAEERELQRQEKLEHARKRKRQEQRTVGVLTKKPKSESKQVEVSTLRVPKKRAAHSSVENLVVRSSSRTLAVKNKEVTNLRIEQQKRRKASIQSPKVREQRVFTQEERIERAKLIEEQNIESLHSFFEQEIERKNNQRSAMFAQRRVQLGPFIRWKSFISDIPITACKTFIEEVEIKPKPERKKRVKKNQLEKNSGNNSSVQNQSTETSAEFKVKAEKSDILADVTLPETNKGDSDKQFTKEPSTEIAAGIDNNTDSCTIGKSNSQEEKDGSVVESIELDMVNESVHDKERTTGEIEAQTNEAHVAHSILNDAQEDDDDKMRVDQGRDKMPEDPRSSEVTIVFKTQVEDNDISCYPSSDHPKVSSIVQGPIDRIEMTTEIDSSAKNAGISENNISNMDTAAIVQDKDLSNIQDESPPKEDTQASEVVNEIKNGITNDVSISEDGLMVASKAEASDTENEELEESEDKVLCVPLVRCSQETISLMDIPSDQKMDKSFIISTLFGNDSATDQPVTIERHICPITGKPARFQDPLTGVCYSNMDSFKIIRLILSNAMPWNSEFGDGMYYGIEDDHDKPWEAVESIQPNSGGDGSLSNGDEPVVQEMGQATDTTKTETDTA
ncbi:YL1 nuclear protein-domain-containing protein [Dipodascopsis uninucleata]